MLLISVKTAVTFQSIFRTAEPHDNPVDDSCNPIADQLNDLTIDVQTQCMAADFRA